MSADDCFHNNDNIIIVFLLFSPIAHRTKIIYKSCFFFILLFFFRYITYGYYC